MPEIVKDELFLSLVPSPATKLKVKLVVSESVAVNVPATVPIATSSSIDMVDVEVPDELINP